MLFSIIPFKPPVPNRRILLAYRRHFVRPRALQAIKQAIMMANIAGVTIIEDDEQG